MNPGKEERIFVINA